MLPIIFWLIQRRYPRSWVRLLHAPVIFSGPGYIPPATPLNYLTWGVIGIIFNRFIRNKWRGWWMRFNCAFLFLSLSLPLFLWYCD